MRFIRKICLKERLQDVVVVHVKEVLDGFSVRQILRDAFRHFPDRSRRHGKLFSAHCLHACTYPYRPSFNGKYGFLRGAGLLCKGAP